MKPLRAVSPRIPAEIPAMDASEVRLKKEKGQLNEGYNKKFRNFTRPSYSIIVSCHATNMDVLWFYTLLYPTLVYITQVNSPFHKKWKVVDIYLHFGE